MEAVARRIQANNEADGRLSDRSLCITPDSSTEYVYELEARSRSSGHICTDYTNMANSAVVSNAGVNGNKKTHTDHSSTRPVEESQGRKLPPDPTRVTESSRRVSLRRSLTEEGISEEASKLIMSSWRGNTEAGWKRWERWCVERGYEPVRSSLSAILEFLTTEFLQGKQYRTINTYRSAISMTHGPIDGVVVRKYPLVCRLLKAVYNQRPPQPRYTHYLGCMCGFASWDPERRSFSS